MSDELEAQTFDLLVLGTGLPECMVAAGAAMAGKKVIHLDGREFYGGHWATLCVREMDEFLDQDNATTTVASQPPTSLTIHSNEFSHPRDISKSWRFQPKKETPTTAPPTAEAPATTEAATTEAATTETATTETATTETATAEATSPIEASQESQQTLSEKVLKRDFLIDVSPRLLLCRGNMIDSLVRAGSYHYQQFQQLDRMVVYTDNAFVAVPCGKGDVFASKSLTLIEKRMLMKFMTHLGTGAHAPQARRLTDLDTDVSLDDKNQLLESEINSHTTLASFLLAQQLTPKLRNFISYALALAETDQFAADGMWLLTAQEGVARIRAVLQSLGRFGNFPFLITMYGAGEYSQGFARLSAVHGALYILRNSAHWLCEQENNNTTTNSSEAATTSADSTTNTTSNADNTATGTTTETHSAKNVEANSNNRRVYVVGDSQGRKLKARRVLLGSGSVVEQPATTNEAPKSTDTQEGVLFRWAGITSSSLVESTDTNQTPSALLVIPPNSFNNPHTVHVVQFGATSEVCPQGYFLVHMTTVAPAGTTTFSWNALESELFDLEQSGSAKPQLVWSCTFSIPTALSPQTKPDEQTRTSSDNGIVIAPLSTAGVCVDPAALIAERLFAQLFPDEPEFLPERKQQPGIGGASDDDDDENDLPTGTGGTNAGETRDQQSPLLCRDYNGGLRVVLAQSVRPGDNAVAADSTPPTTD